MKLIPITYQNSIVDGVLWSRDRFAGLDFTVELHSDATYKNGCLKYVPCSLDSDPTCGHRIRSIFKTAEPVKVDGAWKWKIL